MAEPHTQKPAPAPALEEEERQRQAFTTEMMRERVKLLGPPESASVHSIVKPVSEVRSQQLKVWIRELWVRMLTRIRMHVTRGLYIRLFKSCILIIKVRSHRDLHRIYSYSAS
jgi:hypothetical protein